MMERYQQRDQTDAVSAINILAGLWLIVSTWIFGFVPDEGATWNSIIVGIVVAILAAGRFSRGVAARGLSWVNGVLAVWMIISPFVYGYATNPGRTWNSIVVGIIVLVVALASATGDERAEGSGERGLSPWTPFGWRHGSTVRPEGLFRGVGPRGYRRGDEQIRTEICECMADDARLDASEIDIRVNGGAVILQGTVPDRFARRLAGELSASVGGVRDVTNELRLAGTAAADKPRKVA